MIENINEINRVLLAVSQLAIDSDKGVPYKNVVGYCNEMVIGGNFPNHDDTIDFCKQIKLIRQEGNRVTITSLGNKLLSLNKKKGYDLTQKQKTFLVDNCFLSGALVDKVRGIISQFSSDYEKGVFYWSRVDDLPLKDNMNILQILIQIGILVERKDAILVSPRYSIVADRIVQNARSLTPEELVERLDNQQKLGRIAEEIVLSFEKKRLQEQECLVESESIQQISKVNVSAGYDIESYNGKSRDMIHDRFIEVKGSGGDRIHFYWSPNEIEAARKLRDKYWLYFVPNVSLKNERSDIEPLMIRNPIKSILKNSKFQTRCSEYEVLFPNT